MKLRTGRGGNYFLGCTKYPEVPRNQGSVAGTARTVIAAAT